MKMKDEYEDTHEYDRCEYDCEDALGNEDEYGDGDDDGKGN